jgi:Zn-dependent M28 family amino/carboxypeptidase
MRCRQPAPGRIAVTVCIFLMPAMLTCGGKPPASSVPAFDRAAAFDLLLRQCAFGPRVPGTAAHDSCLLFLESRLNQFADNVVRQSFSHTIEKSGQKVELTNLIASFNLSAVDRILLCAHWDSRPWADQDADSSNHNKPVIGANDGASGVAALLEIARLLRTTPPPVGVDLILFDGEDLGMAGRSATFAAGSRYFANKKDERYRPRYGILLDMVGDRNLNLYKEGNSVRYAGDVVDRVWGLARRLDVPEFHLEQRYEVADDHVPLLNAGIPCIDLIDFDYPYWHTVADTPDKCSPESLEKVGRVVLAAIYDPAR